MSAEGRLVSTWYRSLLPDGSLWCESSDPGEVVARSRGRGCTFQRYEVRQTEGPWKPWEIRRFLNVPVSYEAIDLGWPAFAYVAHELDRWGVDPSELVWLRCDEFPGYLRAVFGVRDASW